MGIKTFYTPSPLLPPVKVGSDNAASDGIIANETNNAPLIFAISERREIAGEFTFFQFKLDRKYSMFNIQGTMSNSVVIFGNIAFEYNILISQRVAALPGIDFEAIIGTPPVGSFNAIGTFEPFITSVDVGGGITDYFLNLNFSSVFTTNASNPRIYKAIVTIM